MKIEQRDLFGVPEEYRLAHCISSDFGMGAGIVVMFNKLFDMKNILKSKYKPTWKGYGYAIKEGRVYNLITKQFVYEKPTYSDLRIALRSMRVQMQASGERKVAMPLIGCGIDGLKWSKVSMVIEQEFASSGIEVLICYLERDADLLAE